MKKVNIKNLKAGKTVYYVHALGVNSFVTKHLITGRPTHHHYKNLPEILGSKSDSLFVPCKQVFSDGNIEEMSSSFSLIDCNVEHQNGYNKHRIFFNRNSADRYCKLCKQCDIDLIEYKFYNLWDYPLELDDPYYDHVGDEY